jgi:eukaryotic-like serine/threonine-protein kinase
VSEEGIGSEDTVAAPSAEGPVAGRVTKRESDPLVVKPAGSVTRASSPSLERAPPTTHPDDYEDLLPVDPAHYKVVREIARGGMGRILEVRDRRLGRNVAIKEVLVADEAGLARFEREVAITARLQHPAIVHVHEAGRWPDGKPFYVMKLIRGKPLDARIAKATSLAQRLELLAAVITVVDALAYAHSQNVIHRDLKPANVLVGDFGETIVIDWGIAKAIGDPYDPVSLEPDRAQNTETIAGSVIGTPSYMPPEQASGDRVDARADVYSLGALLYQVLAGKPPFVGRTTAEVLAKVLDESPPRLSEIDPEIPADLIAIVEKAMAREPAARFPTANEMVIELKRFQQGKLIASRQYTKWELAKRWLYRYRAAVGVALVAMAALAVATLVYIIQVREEAARADQKAVDAMLGADRGSIALAKQAMTRDAGEALAILKRITPGSPKWNDARMVASDAALRGISSVLVQGQTEVYQLVYSPDGRLLAEHGANGVIRVWDLATGIPRFYVPSHARVYALGFDTNTTLIEFAFDGNVSRWDLVTGTRTLIRQIEGEINQGSLSADAKQLLVFDVAYRGRLIELSSGKTIELGKYSDGAWAPDGASVVLSDRRRVDRYVLATGATTNISKDPFKEIGTDGVHVWGTGWDGKIGSVKVLTGTAVQEVIGHSTELKVLSPGRIVVASDSLALTGPGELWGNYKGTLLSIDPDRLSTGHHGVHIVDTTVADAIDLLGHHAQVTAIGVSPDGTVATGDTRGEIRIWRVPAIRRLPVRPHAANRAFLSPDRRYLAVSRRGPAFEIHDLQTGALRDMTADYETGTNDSEGFVITTSGTRRIGEQFRGPNHEIVELVRPMRGMRFATIDQKKRATVWDVASGRGRMVREEVGFVAISPDGDQVATLAQQVVQVWDTSTGAELWSTRVAVDPTALAIGPRGIVMVAGAPEQFQPVVFEVTRDRLRALPYPTTTDVRLLAVAPDGSRAFGAGHDGNIHVWDLATGLRRTWIGHTGTVITFAFSPSGNQLASSGADNEVRVWNMRGDEVATCRGHEKIAPTIVFEDEDTVVSSSLDRTARICDVTTGETRALRGAATEVIFAAHVGSRVLTVDRFHQIAEYPDDLPRGELLLRAWLDSATNVLK